MIVCNQIRLSAKQWKHHCESDEWKHHAITAVYNCFLRKVVRQNHTDVMSLPLQFDERERGLLREAFQREGECVASQKRGGIKLLNKFKVSSSSKGCQFCFFLLFYLRKCLLIDIFNLWKNPSNFSTSFETGCTPVLFLTEHFAIA